MSGEKQLSDARGEGALLGQSTTDKVGFFGATPVVKQTSTSLAGITLSSVGPLTSTNGSSISAVNAAVNAIAYALYQYGLLSS